MFSQLLVCLFNIEPCQDQSNEKVKDHRHPQIHDVEHVHGGRCLHRSAADISAEGQKPSGKGGTNAAAKLCSKGGTGIHCAVYTFPVREVGVF